MKADSSITGPLLVLTIVSRGVKVMTCKACTSENQRKFSSEICVHFPGLKNLDKPAVMVFPKLLICVDCGFTEFVTPEAELRLLGKDTPAHATARLTTPERNAGLSEFVSGLPFSSREIETFEGAADKPLAAQNCFYRH